MSKMAVVLIQIVIEHGKNFQHQVAANEAINYRSRKRSGTVSGEMEEFVLCALLMGK